MGIIDDIKNSYRKGSMLLRIIYINIALFLLVRVAAAIILLFNSDPTIVTAWVELPSNIGALIRRPWTLITYMFAHYGLLHILFNMLWLYWLGRIFLESFSAKQLSGVYVLGGLGGAALYLLAFNLTGRYGVLIGASASVLAIVVAIAVYRPDYKIGLLFIGDVSLKWVAIVTIVIDLLSFEDGNYGGHIAHIGGALGGLAFALQIKKGKDITRPLNRLIDSIYTFCRNLFSKNKGQSNQRMWEPTPPTTPPPTPNQKAANNDEAKLDAILDKIKHSGYDALTDEEKETLFNASRRR